MSCKLLLNSKSNLQIFYCPKYSQIYKLLNYKFDIVQNLQVYHNKNYQNNMLNSKKASRPSQKASKVSPEKPCDNLKLRC